MPRVSGNAIDWERFIENRKSSVRCKVEHPFQIVKNIFEFRKTVCRGLRKNLNRLHVLFASTNMYLLARAVGSPRVFVSFGQAGGTRSLPPKYESFTGCFHFLRLFAWLLSALISASLNEKLSTITNQREGQKVI